MGDPTVQKRVGLTPPEKLRRYMKKKNINAAELSRRCHIPPAQMSALINGHRRAGLVNGLKIEDGTHGYLKAWEWVDFVPVPRGKTPRLQAAV